MERRQTSLGAKPHERKHEREAHQARVKLARLSEQRGPGEPSVVPEHLQRGVVGEQHAEQRECNPYRA
jgi:hypothetical protein